MHSQHVPTRGGVYDARDHGADRQNWANLSDVSGALRGSGGDGDLFVRGNNDGIGIGGSYHGTIVQDAWHRVAVAIQPSGTSYLLEKYIDGALVGTTTSGTPLDGRHAVKNVLNLFADEDGETAAGLVNSVAYYNVALSANEIGALGAASGGGVPSVPEPSTALLLFGGFASLGLRRRG